MKKLLLTLLLMLVLLLPFMILRDFTPGLELHNFPEAVSASGGKVWLFSLCYFLISAVIITVCDRVSRIVRGKDWAGSRVSGTALTAGVVGFFIGLVISIVSRSVFAMLAVPVSIISVYLTPKLSFRLVHTASAITAFLLLLVSVLSYFIPDVATIINIPALSSVYAMIAGAVMFICNIIALCLKKKENGIWKFGAATAIGILLSVTVMSLQMDNINRYIGFGTWCSMVSPDEDVYTLGIRDADKASIILGREVHDYSNDFASFLKKAPESGRLIVNTASLGKSATLQKFLEGKKFETCGAVTVYTLNAADRKDTKLRRSSSSRKQKKGQELQQ